MPGLVDFETKAVEVNSKMTKGIKLKTPIISGAQDSLTGTEMAISIALAGGFGVIHRDQSMEAQADMVRKVKGFMTGFVITPVTLSPSHTVAHIDHIKSLKGFSGIPITDTGQLGGKLLGLLCARDIENIEDRRTSVGDIMIRKMVTMKEPVTLGQAKETLRVARVGRLPITDTDGNFVSIVTRGDMKSFRDYPKATRDQHGQLMVGASVIADTDADWARARTQAEAGVDALFVDLSVGFSDRPLEFIRAMKEEFPGVQIIAGPVTSCRAAKRLADAGADAIR